MKFSRLLKTCLCLFGWLTPCFVLTASGQETYKPMLKDGRVWNCKEVYLGKEKNDTVTHEYRIEGTSEIDGHICYNLYLENKLKDRYYEVGPKVFHQTLDGWELLFDFSLSAHDTFSYMGGLVVDEVKVIEMNGVPRRCLYFPLTANDGTKLCWIEGIGSSISGPYNHNVQIGTLLNEKLQSVYDGDVCIFEAQVDTGTTGISSHLRETDEKNLIYDLQGRRLNSQFIIHNSQLKHGIYIQDGKKVVR